MVAADDMTLTLSQWLIRMGDLKLHMRRREMRWSVIAQDDFAGIAVVPIASLAALENHSAGATKAKIECVVHIMFQRGKWRQAGNLALHFVAMAIRPVLELYVSPDRISGMLMPRMSGSLVAMAEVFAPGSVCQMAVDAVASLGMGSPAREREVAAAFVRRAVAIIDGAPSLS